MSVRGVESVKISDRLNRPSAFLSSVTLTRVKRFLYKRINIIEQYLILDNIIDYVGVILKICAMCCVNQKFVQVYCATCEILDRL